MEAHVRKKKEDKGKFMVRKEKSVHCRDDPRFTTTQRLIHYTFTKSNDFHQVFMDIHDNRYGLVAFTLFIFFHSFNQLSKLYSS